MKQKPLPTLCEYVHEIQPDGTFSLEEPEGGYRVILNVDIETPLWVIELERYWHAYQANGRCVDFAVIDTERRCIVFLELRRTLVREEHFDDKVNQAAQAIERLCYTDQRYGRHHHDEARGLWTTNLTNHRIDVCIVPAKRLKLRANLRAEICAPDGRKVPVITAGTLRQSELSWQTVLRRLGYEIN